MLSDSAWGIDGKGPKTSYGNANENFFNWDAMLYGWKHEQHLQMINKAMDFSKIDDKVGLKAVIGTYTPGKPATLSKYVRSTDKRMR